jgi:hypothetical protein
MTLINKINPIMFRAVDAEAKSVEKHQTNPAADKKDSRVTEQYLDNLAAINAPVVTKADKKQTEIQPYKNNLRSMIRNNESVMLAIIPRIFNAKDLNGDDRISIKSGE